MRDEHLRIAGSPCVSTSEQTYAGVRMATMNHDDAIAYWEKAQKLQMEGELEGAILLHKKSQEIYPTHP
jgi:hypothetical protein